MESKDGKYLFGVCVVGERGQIVIPKKARDIFQIKPGDSLVLLGDINQGLAIIKSDVIKDITNQVFNNTNGEKKEG